MTRREQLSDAAIGVVAGSGLKGLTHRAVDRAAQVPPGTTSNYFRTRADLVAAMADRLEERDWELWAQAGPEPETLEAFVAGLAELTATLVAEQAAHLRVRIMLSLDSPDRFRPGHARLTAGVAVALAGYGVAEPERRATGMADLCDGLMLHAVSVRPGSVDVPGLTASLLALIGADPGPRTGDTPGFASPDRLD